MQPMLQRKSIENIFFKKHLRSFSSAVIDATIHQLTDEVTPQIDCTQCANCCKQLEPGIEDHELIQLAEHEKLSPEEFKSLHTAFDGQSVFLKTKPCMFLRDCKCSIYTLRPAACSGYPHLHQRDMKYKRSLWENYNICPIVFNVIESLKSKLNFKYEG